MGDSRLAPVVAAVKSKVPFPELFRELFPEHYRTSGNSLCPFHDDSTASFQVASDHGFCHAGCETPNGKRRFSVVDLWMRANQCSLESAVRSLAERVGVQVATENRRSNGLGELVETYQYSDEQGALLYEVCRYNPKNFRQRRPDLDHAGRWVWNLQNTRRVLFRLPQVLTASEVWIVEGEKDVLSLESDGLTATTAAQGAAKWQSQCQKYAIHEPLRGKSVCIVPDNDPPGRRHARQIAESLVGLSSAVRIIELPGLGEKQDVSNFIALHGPEEGRKRLLELSDSTPEYVPEAADMSRGASIDNKKPRQSRFLKGLQLVKNLATDIFKDQLGEGYITIKQGDGFRNVPLESKEFSQLLLRLYVGAYEEPLPTEARKNIAEYLTASVDHVRELSPRLHWYGSTQRLLIDTGNPDWCAIQVDAQGWKAVYPAETPFKRYAHQASLFMPVVEGDPWEVLKFVPIRDRRAQELFLIWLTVAYLPHIPRPLLSINGPKGSGKSIACKFICQLLDPSHIDPMCFPRDETEFLQTLEEWALVPFDNLRALPLWGPDAVCRSITGSGARLRRLYSDRDAVLYTSRRAVLMNSISVPSWAEDLIDRSVLIELSRLDETSRLDEEELLSSFREAAPRIVSGLLNALAATIRAKPTVKLGHKPRMADFANWGFAAAEALGIGGERFLSNYNEVIARQSQDTLGSTPIAMALLEFLQGKAGNSLLWAGPAHELLQELQGTAERLGLAKDRSWPRSSSSFSTRLKRLTPDFAAVGYRLEWVRSGHGGNRLIQISRTEAARTPLEVPQRKPVDGDALTRQEGLNFSRDTSRDTMKECSGTGVSPEWCHADATSYPSREKRIKEKIEAWGCLSGCGKSQVRQGQVPRCLYDWSPELSQEPLDMTAPGFTCPRESAGQYSART